MYGYCDDISNGVCAAFSQAEEQSQKEKSKKKIQSRQIAFKENAPEILVEELRAMLAQLRIHIEELSNQQKSLLKYNIAASFEASLRTPVGISEDVKDILLQTKDQDFIQQRIDDLDKKLLEDFHTSITPEQRTNYILSNILSRTPVDTVEMLDYFFQRYSNQLVSSDKKKTLKKLSKQALVTLEISGIKDVNDTYGHTKCDQMVYQVVAQVEQLLDSHGIKKDYPIFAYNISSYGLLIPAAERERIQELCTAISSLDSEFKMAMSSSRLGDNIDSNALSDFINDTTKTPTDLLFYLLNSANSNNLEQNKKSISVQKINDKRSMSRYISRHLKKIIETLGQPLDTATINLALAQVLGDDTSLVEGSGLNDEKHLSSTESREDDDMIK